VNYVPPRGSNWGLLKDPKLDELINTAHTSFDPGGADQGAGRRPHLHRRPGLLGLDRLRPQPARHESQSEGFVQAQSWFQDLTTITMQ